MNRLEQALSNTHYAGTDQQPINEKAVASAIEQGFTSSIYLRVRRASIWDRM